MFTALELRPKIKGIIFDMDGTLLDSMPEWKRAAENFLARYGIVPDAEIYDFFMTHPVFEVGEYLKHRFALHGTAKELAEEINAAVEDAYIHNIQPKPHVLQMLEFLKSKGVKMAVATASDRHLAQAVFRRTGILPYLDGIVTCSDVGRGKSHPDVYYAAAELLGIEKENTAVMEDALYAAVTAAKAGFFVIGVKEDTMSGDEPELKETVHLYIEDAKEIYTKAGNLF